MSWPPPGRYTYSDPDGSNPEVVVVASPFRKKGEETPVYYLTDDGIYLWEQALRGQRVACLFAGAGWGLALALSISLMLIR